VGNLPDAVVRRGMELFRDRIRPHVGDAVVVPSP
jgi:hypothetical protein